jgi:hypothetical protein
MVMIRGTELSGQRLWMNYYGWLMNNLALISMTSAVLISPSWYLSFSLQKYQRKEKKSVVLLLTILYTTMVQGNTGLYWQG